MLTKADVIKLFEYEKNPQAHNGPVPRPIPDSVRTYYLKHEARKHGHKGKRAEKNAAKGETAELLLYDIIGEDFFGGISANEVYDQLQGFHGANQILVRINSEGGAVFDGMAIHKMLSEQPVDVLVSIDGLAASIASVIAMAGDEIQVTPQSMMMIHNAWAVIPGDADELERQAALLRKVSEQIADVYATRTGVDVAKVKEMMSAETWMTGQEAVDAGFATKLVDGKSPKQRLAETINSKLGRSHAA